MKYMKKLSALLLALIMVLSLTAGATAAETTGTITINNAQNVTVEGKTFNAYKILDLKLVGEGTDMGYIYTVPTGLESFYATEFNLDAAAGDFDYEVTQKIAAMTDNSDALFAFASKALNAAKTANVTLSTVTGTTGATSVTFTDLPLGYYVVEDAGEATPISALILDSTNPNVTVTIKADKPGMEKKIDGDTDTDDSTSGKVDYNNAAIGDKVPYVLTSAVPDMTGYTKYFYVVTDTMSKGLTFNNDVVIKVGDKTLVKDTEYTVTVTNNDDGTTTVKIVFINFIQYKEQKGAAIDIRYSATVDTDAEIGVVGNPNKVQLEYSNNPNITPEGENEPTEKDPTGKTPEDETRTYVTEIIINKVDNQGNKLTGAEFTLSGTKLNKVIITKEVFTENENGTYWKLTDGTFTTEDPAAEGMDQTKYESTTVKYIKETKSETVTTSETVKATATVGSDGLLTFTGLSAGEYTITEIKAPNGYNLLTAPITVVIGWTAPTEGTDCVWTYTWTDNNNVGNSTNENQINIVNNAGVELPETGGMGTTLFYIVGGILVLAAVVLLVTKKRMSSAE